MKKKFTLFLSFIAILGSVIAPFFISSDLLNIDLKDVSLSVILVSVTGWIMGYLTVKLYSKKRKGIVYLAYSLEDKEIAADFKRKLEKLGYICYPNLDTIFIGDPIKVHLNKELDKSSSVIFFISEHSNNSPYIMQLTKDVIKKRKKIIPVLLDNKAEVPSFLKKLKCADYTNRDRDVFYQIVSALFIQEK